MLSIEQFKKIIKAKENGLTNEDVVRIMELFQFWATLEFKNYQKK